MKRVDVVSAIIHDSHGNLLMVKNTEGESYYWTLPGGAVEEGETLEQAVIREVREETGLNVTVTGLSSVREKFFLKSQHHVLFITFRARVTDGELTIYNDPDNDIAEVKWVDAHTAQELMPSLFESLRLGHEGDQTPAFYAYEGTQFQKE